MLQMSLSCIIVQNLTINCDFWLYIAPVFLLQWATQCCPSMELMCLVKTQQMERTSWNTWRIPQIIQCPFALDGHAWAPTRSWCWRLCFTRKSTSMFHICTSYLLLSTGLGSVMHGWWGRFGSCQYHLISVLSIRLSVFFPGCLL